MGIWGCPSVSAQGGSGFRRCGTRLLPVSASFSLGADEHFHRSGRASFGSLSVIQTTKNSSLWPHLKNSRLVRLVSRIPSWTSRCDLRRLGWASTRITCSFPGIPTPGSFPRIGSLSHVTSLGPTGGLRLPPALCSPCCSPLWDGIVRACLGAHCPPLPAEDKPPGSGLATAEAPAPR